MPRVFKNKLMKCKTDSGIIHAAFTKSTERRMLLKDLATNSQNVIYNTFSLVNMKWLLILTLGKHIAYYSHSVHFTYDTPLCTRAFPSTRSVQALSLLHCSLPATDELLCQSPLFSSRQTLSASVQLYKRSTPFFYDAVLVGPEQNSAACMGVIVLDLLLLVGYFFPHKIDADCFDCFPSSVFASHQATHNDSLLSVVVLS